MGTRSAFKRVIFESMARIQLSGFVSDISGSVRGSTFQRIRSGYVVRSKPMPRKGNSVDQQNVLSIQRIISTYWTAMSEADQLQWNQFAEFAKVTRGKQYSHVLTGVEVFRMINYYLLAYGESVKLIPVFEPANYSGFFPVSIVNDGSLYVTYNDTLDPSEQRAILSIGYPFSEGYNTPPSNLRLMIIDTPNSDEIDITSVYTAKFGTLPPVGSIIWIRSALQSINNGLLSTFFYARLQVEEP